MKFMVIKTETFYEADMQDIENLLLEVKTLHGDEMSQKLALIRGMGRADANVERSWLTARGDTSGGFVSYLIERTE